MPLITDERADDLAIFYQKIYNQFRKKGLCVEEALDLLTIMICSIAKRSGLKKEELISCINTRWDNLEDEEEQ